MRVAYPEVPERWAGWDANDLAAQDLAAIWGLPLLRYDEAGQLRRGLARDWAEEDGGDHWDVVLSLAGGRWSDGTEVTSADVVASIDAARSRLPRELAALRDVLAVDAHGVRLVFDVPYHRWPDLLASVGPVLPARMLETDGVAAFADTLPLSGGWFRLAGQDPGRSVTFEANPQGPLGPPALERLEVLFVPRYDTALGLLADHQVDAVVGYTALNAVARAEQVDAVAAAAPLGGTWVGLDFRAGGDLGGVEDGDARRGIGGVIDVSDLVEGLLGPQGAVATSPWPGIAAPLGRPAGELPDGVSLVIVSPSFNEVTGFTARAVERDLTGRNVTVDLVSEPSPRFVRAAASERDAALVVRRDPPRPSLTAWVDEADLATAQAGDAAVWPSLAGREALDLVARTARVLPLYRVGVLHAWSEQVEGVRPSAWPGAGFWNLGDWSLSADPDGR